MNLNLEFFQTPLAERIGWTLLHFLWQGTVLAGVLSLGQRLLRNRSADVHYALACLALLAMTAAPVVTFLRLPSGDPSVPAAANQQVTAVQNSGSSARATVVDGTGALAFEGTELAPLGRMARTVESFLPGLTVIWMAGVALLSMRLLAGWIRVRVLRVSKTTPIEQYWPARLAELQERLQVRRKIRLLLSPLVDVPMVIGWLRPTILLPGSALSGLTPAQFEAVLLHELAHVRRHDYLVNLRQSIVETLLFYLAVLVTPTLVGAEGIPIHTDDLPFDPDTIPVRPPGDASSP